MGSLNWIIITMIFMFCRFETSSSSIQEKTYIVHVEQRADVDDQRTSKIHSYHKSFFSVANETSIIYSYRTVISGFAAKLSPNELREMSRKKGFISARPETTFSLHTTHSPQFLGLNQNTDGMWRDSNYGRGVIIGVIDTGITPKHISFSNKGMPPPPAKWKGSCEFADRTMCNNKIIGARSFGKRKKSDLGPFDEYSHGTHTSSTAAGNFVAGASYFGNANGTASGIAPLAHIAIYKVCINGVQIGTCEESDVVAAMDAAIHDGVDVLSISMAFPYVDNFYNDTMAIGAFRAMEKGIFVSCSAGNNGPFNFSMFNEAPWVLTVGASTTDRQLRATAVLGNGQQFQGQSALQPMSLARRGPLPLVYSPGCGSDDSFNHTNIKGKVVVCESLEQNIEVVKSAGGAAIILLNDQMSANTTSSDSDVLPAVSVSYADGLKIKAYINSTKKPTAKIIFGGTVIGGDDDRAPAVASFSSRGPSTASRGILKPDVIGPGVSILAASNSKSELFILESGTSMACPHLSGVAALLKSAHPDWTPAAIKSAIMTTADVVNHAHNPIEDETFLPAGVFDTGSGHVNPPRAINPGLVYDIQPTEYIPYLCGLNYTNQQVGMILQKKVDCSKVSSIRDSQLNYPAFVLVFADQPIGSSQKYTRTVTNVGEAHSTYKVSVASPPGFEVRVSPKELRFTKLKQKMRYEVTFKRVGSTADDEKPYVEGYLKWDHCGKQHSVRSPIAIILDGRILG